MQKKCQARVSESSKPEDAHFLRAGRRATIEQVQERVAKVLGQRARAFQRQRKLGGGLLAWALVAQARLTQPGGSGGDGVEDGCGGSVTEIARSCRKNAEKAGT